MLKNAGGCQGVEAPDTQGEVFDHSSFGIGGNINAAWSDESSFWRRHVFFSTLLEAQAPANQPARGTRFTEWHPGYN